MADFYLLLSLSVVLFVGSFLAGLIPLAFNISERRTRLLSTFGAGLLVGTALSVIVPEGVEALYIVHTEKYLSQVVRNVDTSPAVVINQNDVSSSLKQFSTSNLDGGINHLTDIYNNNIGKEMIKQVQQRSVMSKKESDEHGHFEAPINFSAINKSIGYSLVVGFLFMFLVDEISKYLSTKGNDRAHFKLTATIGLVVHAAADGFAIGSAFATNRTDVQFIIFFAIMLHKAPAAFGLVTFLLVEGVERFRIRRHLTIFSIAAPAAALVTYYLIVIFESDKSSADSATGVLMLFSAGTFLYVAAVHILPELIDSNVKGYQLVSSGIEGSNRGYNESTSSLKLIEFVLVFVGAISPLFLISSHSHAH